MEGFMLLEQNATKVGVLIINLEVGQGDKVILELQNFLFH